MPFVECDLFPSYTVTSPFLYAADRRALSNSLLHRSGDAESHPRTGSLPKRSRTLSALTCSGCATMSNWSAIGVSIVSALVYHVSYRGVMCFKIDDAVNAAAVHLFCGCWGLIASGFTATDTARSDVEYPDGDSCPRSAQLATNAFMAIVILAWVRWSSLTETSLQTSVTRL